MIAALGVLAVAAVFALLVAGFTAWGSHQTIRVLVYVRQQARWVPSLDLRDKFGGGVYVLLDKLVDAGLIENRELPGTPERGGRSRLEYRWKGGR